MKSRFSLALVAVYAFAGPAAQAATSLTEWGTLATISTYSCVDDLCDPQVQTDPLGAASLLFLNTFTVDPVDGAVGQTSAAVATPVAWPNPGSASGTANVASGLGVPILKAGAASTTKTWLAGQALAIQAYTYNGPGETLELAWNLSGSITNPDSDPVTGLVVFAGFFTSGSAPDFPDVSDPMAAFALLASAALGDPADNVLEFTATGAVSETGTISITVTEAEEFYLVMGLMAGAGGSGALAESLSTLEGDFVGTPDLTPAFSAVPLPPAMWLVASALGGLAARRRRG